MAWTKLKRIRSAEKSNYDFFFNAKSKKLRDSGSQRFFLSSLIVYEPILIRIYMNAKIMKMQILHKIKYDLKGHIGSS